MTQIGYYSDTGVNLISCLKSSKVLVMLADGRVATAQMNPSTKDAFWVRFSDEIGDGMEILYKQANDAVLEILGLICGHCGESFRVQRFHLGWCDECTEQSKRISAVRTFDSNREFARRQPQLSEK